MITKSISAPTGAGITLFVSENARIEADGRQVLVLYAHPEMCAQWKRYLPDADTISVSKFLKDGCKPDALIIVTEMSDPSFRRLLIGGLADVTNDVWLVNRPITGIYHETPHPLRHP